MTFINSDTGPVIKSMIKLATQWITRQNTVGKTLINEKDSKRFPSTEYDPMGRFDHYAALLALQKRHQLLEVIRDGESYQSFILDTNIASGVFTLDGLFPPPGSNFPRAGNKLTIRHHKSGKVLSFTSSILDIDHNDSAPVYRLALPGRIGYHERRRGARICFDNRPPLAVTLLSPLRLPWYATALDLSSGGMCLTVGGNITTSLKRDTLLPRCEFQFNTDFRICCQAAVRAFRFVRKPHRQTRISVEFIDLPPAQRLQLRQYIQALEDVRARAA